MRTEVENRNEINLTKYTDKVQAEKLLQFVKDLKNGEISRKRYNFRLASPEVSSFWL